MFLGYESRLELRRAIDHAVRETLLSPASGNAQNRTGLPLGSSDPWYLVVPHIPSDAHRILPTLDEQEMAA